MVLIDCTYRDQGSHRDGLVVAKTVVLKAGNRDAAIVVLEAVADIHIADVAAHSIESTSSTRIDN